MENALDVKPKVN